MQHTGARQKTNAREPGCPAVRFWHPACSLLPGILAFLLGARLASAAPIEAPYASRDLAEVGSKNFDWHDDARNRDVPVKVYFPKRDMGPAPVILFSHGLGGTRETYAYLGEQWAANGYIVVHVQHIGSDDSVWRGQARPLESLKEAANYKNAAERPKDISFAIDQLEKLNKDDADFKGRFDLKHIGVAGHSFGGQTSFLIGGQRMALQTFADSRVSAIIPMSSAIPEMGNLDNAYKAVTIPTFMMTGTKDDSPIGNTKAADRRKAFDHLPEKTTAYLLTFEGGDHAVFSGRSRAMDRATLSKFLELIQLSSTAFWDAYLRDDAKAKAWLHDGSFKEALGKNGSFEQKN